MSAAFSDRATQHACKPHDRTHRLYAQRKEYSLIRQKCHLNSIKSARLPRYVQHSRCNSLCTASLSSGSADLLTGLSSLLAVLPSDPADAAPVGSLAAVLLLLTGYAVWRITAYGRLQYITAAMLGRWVPKGGARVIQVGGGTRDLYYYPKDTILVTAISPKLNKGLMGQAAIQAGVPVDVRQENPTHLSFQGNNSVEAVVCLLSMQTLPDLARFVSETHRVLKPGSPFIFVQSVKGQGLTRAAQLLLGGAGNALEEHDLKLLKTAGFESVEWDIALEGQSPHAIGVALKSGNLDDNDESVFEQRSSKSSKATGRRKAVKAGFGKSSFAS